MLPVFVINLDRRPDRWEAMSAQLDRIGIEPVRIPAIDVRLLIEQERFEEDEPERMLSIGDEACSLSHMKALSAFLRTVHPAALILEDDLEIAPGLPGILASTDWWPESASVIKLETHFEKRRLLWPSIGNAPGGHTLHRIAWNHPGGAGYLIDRQAAGIVLQDAPALTMPIDLLLFSLRDSPTARRLQPVQILPAMLRQAGNEIFRTSDIAPYRTHAWLREFKKRRRAHFGIWTRLRQKLRIVLLQMTGRVRRLPVPFKISN